MLSRLITNWVYGGFLASFLVFALIALFHGSLTRPSCWWRCSCPSIWSTSTEEHDDDRFRRFVNLHIGKGRNVLPVAAVFVINIVGVWVVDAVSLWLAMTTNVGWGLIAIYLTLVNALTHIVVMVAQRRYNPGVVTSSPAVPAGGHGWPLGDFGDRPGRLAIPGTGHCLRRRRPRGDRRLRIDEEADRAPDRRGMTGQILGGVRPRASRYASAAMISAAASAAITAGRLSRTTFPPIGVTSRAKLSSSPAASRKYQLRNVAFLVLEPIMPT